MTDHPETTEPTWKRVRLGLKQLANGSWQADGTVEIESSEDNLWIETELNDLLKRVERQTADAITRREGAA